MQHYGELEEQFLQWEKLKLKSRVFDQSFVITEALTLLLKICLKILYILSEKSNEQR